MLHVFIDTADILFSNVFKIYTVIYNLYTHHWHECRVNFGFLIISLNCPFSRVQ